MAQTEPDSRASGPSSPDAPATPLISRNAEGCTECWACVRHCPARAIVITDGEVRVLSERCVECGACVQSCANGGFVVRDDLPAVRALLASERPVVAILASEYAAALHPLTTEQVERALDAVGFAGVETTVLGEELVAAAYEQIIEHDAGIPLLRSTCPVAVDWVAKYYPQLIEALIPVVPPYVAQARLVKSVYIEGAAVVYISPCWARKDESFDARFGGAVDVTIGFDELKRLLSESRVAAQPPDAVQGSRLHATKSLSLIDGFPRRVLNDREATSATLVTVRGLSEIDRLLQGIVRGETAPRVIDMLCCEGCLDGPAIGGELSVFSKRNIVAADRELQPPPPADSTSLLHALPPVELHRSFTATPALSRVPTAEEIDSVLAAGEFASRDETINCGVCGYETCVEHASAIFLNHSSWDLCFPLQRRVMARERAKLSRDALIDPLTGLGNRRTFDQRIAEDVSLALRHEDELSLLMLDIDLFKDINDRHGHTTGDKVLAAVGSMLHEALRIADVACRYGGDEFAVILPGTSKTEAWLVAEKLRSALQELQVESQAGDVVHVRGSLGVASFSPSFENALQLLEAADAALYRAKHSGRDRVELSIG